MTPIELWAFFSLMALMFIVVILVAILRRLDRILDLLLRSLPLPAIALVTPDDNQPEKKAAGIAGFQPPTNE
jgi:hypothetical protein